MTNASQRARSKRSRPELESLESRTVLYSASGNAWMNPAAITISFMPDGTNLGGVASNLSASFDSKPALVGKWQKEILRAAQVWAEQTNINLVLVPDNGQAAGTGLLQQGDPGYGDIRIGGYNFGNTTLARAYMPPPVNNFSIAGDVVFNTGMTYNINDTYDLFTVATHEFGHSLGLRHSALAQAQEFATYNVVKRTLNSDDILGIRSIYSAGAPRAADRFDVGGTNETIATADDITAAIDIASLSATVRDLDITTIADVDYYKFRVPSGPTSTGSFAIQSRGLSLLSPSLQVLDAAGVVKATINNQSKYSSRQTVSVSGLVAGATYYLKVDGTEATALGTGAYAIAMRFTGLEAADVPTPLLSVDNGTPVSSGGGEAVKVDLETRANSYTTSQQFFSSDDSRTVAMDARGNYVIAWTSQGQDGDVYGVFARRFAADGTPLGPEFQLSNTSTGNQSDPTIAMALDGRFVVAWASRYQDGDEWGVYARRFDAAGVPLGGEFLVNTTTAGSQRNPSLAILPSGDLIATWTTEGQDGRDLGIFARRFNSSGAPLGGEFLVNQYVTGNQMQPTVAASSSGNFVVTWASDGQDGSLFGVYARRFDAAGAPLGNEFRVNNATNGDQKYPEVAVSPSGSFVVTWASAGQDGSGYGVYARRFDAAGAPLGNEFLVNSTTLNDQSFPTVATTSYGGFLVAWSSKDPDKPGSSSTQWGIYGQQFDANGQRLGVELIVQLSLDTDQFYPSIAMDELGHVVVAWSGDGTVDGVRDNTGIYFQQYSTQLVGLASDHQAAEDQAPPSDREVFRGLLREYRSAREAGDFARVREVRGVLARLGAARENSGRRAVRGQLGRERLARIAQRAFEAPSMRRLSRAGAGESSGLS